LKNIKLEFKWAFVFSIASLVWMLLEKELGWHDTYITDHYWLTLLFTPLALILYVQALKEKRRRFYGGRMTWLQGFYSGLKLTFFIALFSPAVQYITHNYISPEYFPNIIAYSVENNKMTLAETEAYFTLKTYIIQSALGVLIAGTITTAVVALFLKRK